MCFILLMCNITENAPLVNRIATGWTVLPWYVLKVVNIKPHPPKSHEKQSRISPIDFLNYFWKFYPIETTPVRLPKKKIFETLSTSTSKFQVSALRNNHLGIFKPLNHFCIFTPAFFHFHASLSSILLTCIDTLNI